MDEALRMRVERVQAAIGKAIEPLPDLSRFNPHRVVERDREGSMWDFTGGVPEAEVANFAHEVIGLLAHLGNHVRKWGDRAGRSKADTEAAVKRAEETFPLRVLRNLSNGDKHGQRAGQGFGAPPELRNLHFTLRLTTAHIAGSSMLVRMPDPDGPPVMSGDGSTARVLVAELDQGLGIWEDLLRSWQVGLPPLR